MEAGQSPFAAGAPSTLSSNDALSRSCQCSPLCFSAVHRPTQAGCVFAPHKSWDWNPNAADDRRAHYRQRCQRSVDRPSGLQYRRRRWARGDWRRRTAPLTSWGGHRDTGRPRSPQELIARLPKARARIKQSGSRASLMSPASVEDAGCGRCSVTLLIGRTAVGLSQAAERARWSCRGDRARRSVSSSPTETADLTGMTAILS